VHLSKEQKYFISVIGLFYTEPVLFAEGLLVSCNLQYLLQVWI